MSDPKVEHDYIGDHEFRPVAGHPDDDECTHRADGTDASYCGKPRAWHDHHPRCYQNTGVPDDLPGDLCDCRVLRTIEQFTSDGLTPEQRLLRAIFGNDHEGDDDA